MLFAPKLRLLPFTVREAVALAPEAASVAVPRDTCPSAKEMLPPGAVVPEAGVRVTATCVVALDTTVDGLAVAVMLVATWLFVLTVTVADPEELPR